MNTRLFLIISGILSALSILFGAFGAHTLKTHISQEMSATFETGVRYQFLHALSILIFCCLPSKYQSALLAKACIAMLLGILFFSGSLFLLSTRELTGIGTGILGPVTPLGGICFLIGWILFTANIVRTK